jgi:hypothetical protein
MAEYWGHTLAAEEAGYVATQGEGVYRIDMHRCPSKGFLTAQGMQFYHDYCEHCMGWIRPLMDEAGFAIDHAHNHRGQCWWEIRRVDEAGNPSAPGTLAGERDVRLSVEWSAGTKHLFLASRRCPASDDSENHHGSSPQPSS